MTISSTTAVAIVAGIAAPIFVVLPILVVVGIVVWILARD